ncbi:16S rRNA (uracil(1498)-N(3))-methyltransferase [Ferruginibacter albus]|uniref:16S rRNA (uracil(1498)-N(3))-methyltransferase n=1 Tax=Ferruginibacter albus TaxID=2875540 RepID=UPI001CC3C64B|nr:16S rRNA (uracil(1498)-N(3))-methyltransferase [Ferruginibacter albus]UAY52517.1 16S rRNA (uracil(1498)-N(3))-methyltransferase [Ferruginibacter albus]
MTSPFFYIDNIDPNVVDVTLNEETSKHIVQVLRMQNDEQLNLTDGKGHLFEAVITNNNKKRCEVKINSKIQHSPAQNHFTIAISILKNATRFEWFLEKATEIGVSEIIPLVCKRTERTHFRYDRMNGILISAMLQSQQTWLPKLHQPAEFDKLLQNKFDNYTKLIAHCEEETKQSITDKLINQSNNKLILIGPEGDFTKEEIELALQNNFVPVSLGNTRLRSETAGVVAATLLSLL